jgi:invasion protein IalB
MPSGLLKGFDMRTLSAALAALTLGFAGTAMAQEAVSPSSSASAAPKSWPTSKCGTRQA